MTLLCKIGNNKLLELYGYEPLAPGISISERWAELAGHWTKDDADEIGEMRQAMLQIHKELCPDDERWN